jgi:hypothetical protein
MESATRDGESEVSDDEVLALFDGRTSAQPPLSTAEVAAHLGISTERARERLGALRDAGKVQSRSLTGEKRLWWDPDYDFATAELAGTPRRRRRAETVEE